MWQAIGAYLLFGVLLLSYQAILHADAVASMFDEADQESGVTSPPVVRLIVLCMAILILSTAWTAISFGEGDDI